MINDVRINIIFLIFSHCEQSLHHIVTGLAVTVLLLQVQNDRNTEKYEQGYDRYSIIKCGSYVKKECQDKLQDFRYSHTQNYTQYRPFLQCP